MFPQSRRGDRNASTFQAFWNRLYPLEERGPEFVHIPGKEAGK
jgi:hypothetical protein